MYVCIYSLSRHFHLYTKSKRIGGKFIVFLSFRFRGFKTEFVKPKTLYHSYLLLKRYLHHFSDCYYCKSLEFVLFICIIPNFLCVQAILLSLPYFFFRSTQECALLQVNEHQVARYSVTVRYFKVWKTKSEDNFRLQEQKLWFPVM